MSDTIKIDSRVRELGQFAMEVRNEDLKSEPMFFNCDLNFAMEEGGDVTRSFISALPPEWFMGDVVFDSRVHMLMPGWYPAIPGFHHDDVPRPERIPVGQHFATAGQPDYRDMRYKAEHILGLVHAEVAPTEFAVGEIELPLLDLSDPTQLVYRTWHYKVLEALAEGRMQRYEAPDRTLVQFDWQSFHQAVRARANGWRWFGRVTRNSDRTRRITNEIRSNAQVYLEFPMEGW